MNQIIQTMPTHRATLNGASIEFAASEYDAVIPAFVTAHGGGVPRIEALARPDTDGTAQPLTRLVGHAPTGAVAGPGITRPDAIETTATGERAPLAAPAPAIVRGQTVVESGRARSASDEAGARAGGFTPAQPLYSRGTAVVDLGVENARAARAEFDVMPRVEECVTGFLADFAQERRRDQTFVKHDMQMDKAGRLALPSGERCSVNERAFGPLCNRLGMGGGDYLAKCWPELRAINLNRWTALFKQQHTAKVDAWRARGGGEDAPEASRLVLRTRDVGVQGREVFAAVSENYAAFDVDKVAQALALAMPCDARLRVEYDGFRARFDVLFHSTVQPEDFVAGEFFRGGITIRTDDTGGGSLRGSSFVEQNLCLNLIIIDKQVQPLFSLRHLGSVERLAEQFREGMRAAQDSLSHFLTQWGFARRDDLVAEAAEDIRAQVGADATRMTLSDFFEGFANGVIERELVPLRAHHGATVRDLRRMYLDDTSSDGPRSGRVTRAGVVNALTRYAHKVEVDPWKAEEIERGAAGLLWPVRGKLPAIPFVPVTL